MIDVGRWTLDLETHIAKGIDTFISPSWELIKAVKPRKTKAIKNSYLNHLPVIISLKPCPS